MRWLPTSVISWAADAAHGSSDDPVRSRRGGGAARSAPVLLLFSFRSALFFQCLGRLLFSFFLSIHALAHDSLLIDSTIRTSLLGVAPAQHFTFDGRAIGAPDAGVPPGRIARRLGRLLAHPADAQLTAHHTHLLQILEYLFRHAFRQVDEAMILPNIHAADMYALDSRLVGDGADDIAGLDPMYRPYFDAKSFHGAGGGLGSRLARAFGWGRRVRRARSVRRAPGLRRMIALRLAFMLACPRRPLAAPAGCALRRRMEFRRPFRFGRQQ